VPTQQVLAWSGSLLKVVDIAMLGAVINYFGGVSWLWEMWDRLPPDHSEPLAGPYTLTFFAALSAVLLGLGVWVVLFVLSKSGIVVSKEQLVAWPILVSTVVYVAGGLLWPERTRDRDELINALESDEETAVAAK
jgi:hypothetical protein